MEILKCKIDKRGLFKLMLIELLPILELKII